MLKGGFIPLAAVFARRATMLLVIPLSSLRKSLCSFLIALPFSLHLPIRRDEEWDQIGKSATERVVLRSIAKPRSADP